MTGIVDVNSNKSQNIDGYIAQFPQDIQDKLQQVRKAVHQEAPQAVESISYGMPTFKLHGNLVHFAAFKKHIGFYPTPSGIENFQEKLSPYQASKGAVQFPLDQPLPLDLIGEIVRFRVAENLAKAEAKGKKISSVGFRESL